VDLALSDVSILEDIFDRWHAFAEMRKTKFFKFCTRNIYVEIFTFSKSFTVNFGLMGGGENSLCFLALSS